MKRWMYDGNSGKFVAFVMKMILIDTLLDEGMDDPDEILSDSEKILLECNRRGITGEAVAYAMNESSYKALKRLYTDEIQRMEKEIDSDS